MQRGSFAPPRMTLKFPPPRPLRAMRAPALCGNDAAIFARLRTLQDGDGTDEIGTKITPAKGREQRPPWVFCA